MGTFHHSTNARKPAQTRSARSFTRAAHHLAEILLAVEVVRPDGSTLTRDEKIAAILAGARGVI